MVFKLAERWIETIFVDRYFKIYRIGKIVFINKIALANKYFKLPIVRYIIDLLQNFYLLVLDCKNLSTKSTLKN